MDEALRQVVLRALKSTEAANLSTVEHDAKAIDAVVRDRPDLSPVEAMVLINQIRKR